ncbi:MAG: DUF4384 domain-containing protein [Gemmatimonadota bacterium]
MTSWRNVSVILLAPLVSAAALVLSATSPLGALAFAPGMVQETDTVLQDAASTDADVAVRIWLDQGAEPVFHRGDRSRIYYRVSRDAHVAIFHISTDGLVNLVQPRTPESGTYVRGGREYRLLFATGPYWHVDEHPGMGYFFAVASPEPLDLSVIPFSRRQGSWDLSQVGSQIHRDPYSAIDDFVAWLVPGWERLPYGLDFTPYHVGGTFEYPRFLCYDCHTFRPYTSWDPYRYSCTSFRVVIYDDPYYYPAARYRGSEVVYVRPPLPGEPRFAFKERAWDDATTPLLQLRETAPGSPWPQADGVGRSVLPGRFWERILEPASGLRSLESPSTQGVRVLPRSEGAQDERRPTLQRRIPPRGVVPPVRNNNPPPVRNNNPPPVRNNNPPAPFGFRPARDHLLRWRPSP